MQWKASQKAALVAVDPQIDFCPGGALAVPNGDAVIPALNALRNHFQTVVITQDWHPAGHASFASTHGLSPFTIKDGNMLWPDHCVQGTAGAEFHPRLIVRDTDLILRKGSNPALDSYSAFFENDKKTQPAFADGRGFADTMRAMGITHLVFGGLAREICVAWNAADSRAEGFETYLVMDAAEKLDAGNDTAKMDELKKSGVHLVSAADLPTFNL